jgi:hypothetical protein
MTMSTNHSYAAHRFTEMQLRRGGHLDKFIADPAAPPPLMVAGKFDAHAWCAMRSGVRYAVLYEFIATKYDAERIVVDDPETLARVAAAKKRIRARVAREAAEASANRDH